MTAVQEIDVTDFTDSLDGDVQLIDVREPDEFATGSLPGAVNIPLTELPDRLADIDPQRPVALLCRSGNRSGQAAQFLADHGYDATNLVGGMLAYSMG